MRRIRDHDDDDVGFFGNLPARFADDAACGNQFRGNRPDIVKKQTMPGSLEMASHRASHDPKANEANINHLDLSFHAMRQPFESRTIRGPGRLFVFGLYSQPIQPRYPISSRCLNRKG